MDKYVGPVILSLPGKVRALSLQACKESLFKVLTPWTNGKCLATKHLQTLFGDQTFYRLDTLLDAV